jgi:outer membrane protein TolC
MLQDVSTQPNIQQGRSGSPVRFLAGCFGMLLVAAGSAISAQAPVANQPAATPSQSATQSATPPTTQSPTAQPVAITLDEAIHRAQANDSNYVSAATNNRISRLDRSIARNGLLPSAVYLNQYLYTQGNGPSSGGGSADQPPRFIANNAVREYMSAASVTETFGLSGLAGVRRADAAAAMASAELEVARRGLVSAVTGFFYNSIAADHKLAVAERARQEAMDFSKLTGQREDAREAAHADVVKAQLQQQQRQRELQDATVAAEKARLELGVLLFPDPRTAYSLQADAAPAPLAPRADIEQAASKNNPELKSALASLNVSNADVLTSRAAYLPDLGLNVTYGIDAPQFAVNGPDGTRNLGYSASVTLDIPLWDWFSTQHRIKQSEIRRDVAKVALTTTQRQLIARLDEAYSEAVAAREQLASLEASVSTAGESLRLTKLRYNGGEATVLEVVDAQSAFVTSENALEDGRVRYETARADLQTLTGTM